MTIEIHQPELEALIRERMASGAFRDLDDLLEKALGALDEHASAPPPPAREKQSLVDMCASVRGLLTDEEVDTLFRRDQSPSRDIDLS
jgi:hypothetical protein